MDDLTTWLKARLDDDEKTARAATATLRGEWRVARDKHAEADSPLVLIQGADEHQVGDVEDYTYGVPVIAYCAEWQDEAEANLRHIARHDPARVLREVESKRRMIEWCVEVIGDRDLSRYGESGLLKDDPDALAVTLAVETLKLLALPFSDRPGYREEWAL